MPDFRLRIWAEQTLFDCRDYVVTADTLEAAVTRLQDVQEDADSMGEHVDAKDISSAERGRMDEVVSLDPSEVIDGDNGVTLIDDKGDRLRDLIGLPTGCERLGEPLHAVEPVETMPILIYTLHISHKRRESIWAFDDEDKAHACLAHWTRRWWDKDGPRDPLTSLPLEMPEQDADVVEEYFGQPDQEECWHIGRTHLNAF